MGSCVSRCGASGPSPCAQGLSFQQHAVIFVRNGRESGQETLHALRGARRATAHSGYTRAQWLSRHVPPQVMGMHSTVRYSLCSGGRTLPLLENKIATRSTGTDVAPATVDIVSLSFHSTDTFNLLTSTRGRAPGRVLAHVILVTWAHPHVPQVMLSFMLSNTLAAVEMVRHAMAPCTKEVS